MAIFLLDSHCDAPIMLAKGADFGKNVEQGYEPGKYPVTHVDYARMKKGGVNGSFFAIYTSNKLSPDEATHRALELVSKVYDSVEENSDKVAFAFTPAQARRNMKNGLISIFLGMENGAPIQKDLSLLRMFYRMGVRYMTLTHAGHNEICDSCGPRDSKRWGGVSPFGQEVIAEMNRLGMLVDVSHLSDDSFWDVLKYSKAPVVATHSCCRALCSHRRNLTDEMIKALADKGGVIQINFYPTFLEDMSDEFCDADDAFDTADYAWREDPSNKDLQDELRTRTEFLESLKRPSYRKIVDHIDHVVKLVGVKHVGIGSDFDGINTCPEGLDDISKMQKVIIELRKRGYKENEIKLIAGGNFLRVMEAAQKMAEVE